MKPRIIAKFTTLLALALTGLTATTSWARPPRAQELCGALQVVDRQTHLLTLLTAGNETPLRLAWKADTSLVRNGQFDTTEALKAGAQVCVYYRTPFFGKPFVTKVVWQPRRSVDPTHQIGRASCRERV